MTAGDKPEKGVACDARLWYNSDERKFYLIPPDRDLEQGGLLLRRGNGDRIQVMPDSVAEFEVSEQQAKEWSAKQLRRIGSRLRAGLRRALGSRSSTGTSGGGDGECLKGANIGGTHGLDLLADLSGRRRAELDGDYRAVGEALRSYLADAATTTLEGLSDDPQRKANARRRMRKWGEILRAHGIPARDVDGPDDASSGTGDGAPGQGPGASA